MPETANFEYNPTLRLVTINPLFLYPADGSAILIEAKDVFHNNIDPRFKIWRADERGAATGKTPVLVYEIMADAAFSKIFGSLSLATEDLCLTQAEIKSFVKQFSGWMRDNYLRFFFLFKSYNEFFVAYAYYSCYDNLSVSINRFEDLCSWKSDYRRRLVVPKLA